MKDVIDTSMNPRKFFDRWYEEARIIDSGEDHLLEWLEQQSPDDWHSIISNWNYDSNNAALKWIVSHPNCDMGTAIQLFMIGKDSWDGFKREDVELYYLDAFDTFETAHERLKDEDFTNRELIPSVRYSQDEIRPTYPPILRTYKGLRAADSDFISQDQTIYLSEVAFAEKIDLDYSTIEKTKAAIQAKPYTKLQITVSIITLLVILFVLIK